MCKEDCAWNPSVRAYKCDKDCRIGEQFKDCICLNNFVEDLGVNYVMRLKTYQKRH